MEIENKLMEWYNHTGIANRNREQTDGVVQSHRDS